MGEPVNNLFYIMSVRHTMNAEQGFTTRITAKAAGLGGSYSAGSSGGMLGGMLGGVMDAVDNVMDTVDSAMDMVDDALDDLSDMTGGLSDDIISTAASSVVNSIL